MTELTTSQLVILATKTVTHLWLLAYFMITRLLNAVTLLNFFRNCKLLMMQQEKNKEMC